VTSDWAAVLVCIVVQAKKYKKLGEKHEMM
jgi:hypothetical protein